MKNKNLVLLPGLDGTGRLFEPLLSSLPANVRPLVVRYPVDEPLNYQQLIPQIREVVPWDEPYLIVAESFGGPLALYFTAAQWENNQGLVLVSSFLTNPLPTFMNWVYSMMGDSLFKSVPPSSVLKKHLLGKKHSPALEAALTDTLNSVKPEVIAQRIKLVVESDSSQALRDCGIPVLYLHASHDELLGDRGWNEIKKVKPGVTGFEIEGPHMLLQTRPKESWSAIQHFWTEISAEAEAA